MRVIDVRVELEGLTLPVWVRVTVSFGFKLSRKYKLLFTTAFIKPFFIKAFIKTITDRAPKYALCALSQQAVRWPISTAEH